MSESARQASLAAGLGEPRRAAQGPIAASPVDRARQLVELLAEHDTPIAAWAVTSIQAYLIGPPRKPPLTLGRAFGLEGGRDWRKAEAELANRLLVLDTVAQFFPKESRSGQAKALARAVRNYRAAGWRHDWKRSSPPVASPLNKCCFAILKAKIPTSETSIRRILLFPSSG